LSMLDRIADTEQEPNSVSSSKRVDDDFADITCPFCNEKAPWVMSLFGGNAGESLLQCRICNSVFHWIKWQGKLPPYPHR